VAAVGWNAEGIEARPIWKFMAAHTGGYVQSAEAAGQSIKGKVCRGVPQRALEAEGNALR
jgi:hypothetical protein